MPRRWSRLLLSALMLAPPMGLGIGALGCGPEEIKVQEAPPYTPPPSPKLEDLPKDQRPKPGSSAGMNYDPGGSTGPPPN